MIRLIRRLFASLLVILGLAVVLASGFALFWSDELQQLYLPTLPSSDYAGNLTKGDITVQKGSPIGIIEIPRLGLSSVVLEGDDTAALLFGVGHLSDTPLPWHGGNSVFAAHRDTFFRPLAGIRRNDVIKFSTANAEFEYVVKELKVVEPTELAVLDPTPSATLTLITCFPFDYVGPAPNRFIVKAERRLPSSRQPAA
jgi:LPXTG-site transpeptidase (sortase) family protein